MRTLLQKFAYVRRHKTVHARVLPRVHMWVEIRRSNIRKMAKQSSVCAGTNTYTQKYEVIFQGLYEACFQPFFTKIFFSRDEKKVLSVMEDT